MKIKIYREKVQDKGIYQSHKGEDGKPYVGARALMVADGLGGAAAIRHKEFNQDLFDREKILDALFKGVYDDYTNNEEEFTEFEKYVLESFDDFCEMGKAKEQYFKDILSMKKGGYFGSRIVTAIMLHEILKGEYFWEEGNTVWDKIHAAKSVEELKAAQDEIGDSVANIISEKLEKIRGKANANLRYESSMVGLVLLGSTLCATLYQENKEEGYVEALYFLAGDSRPYVIGDEVDGKECGGLAQVVADQEGADGAMSNCIQANPSFDNADENGVQATSKFGIACEYRRFKTPCILFNASDGCFDSAAFPTQLALEKLLYDCILDNPTPNKENMREGWNGEEERIAEQLRAFFDVYGRHDDSTTIALKSFGFETDANGDDLEAVKEFARKRLAEIKANYLSKGNEKILSVDFAEEAQRLQEKAEYDFKTYKTSVWEKECVKQYCRDVVGKSIDESNEEDLRKELASYEEKRKGLVQEGAETIKPYYLSILDKLCEQELALSGAQNKKLEKANHRLTNAKNLLQEIEGEAKEYQESLEKIKNDLQSTLQSVKEKNIDAILAEDSKDWDFNKTEKDTLESLDEIKKFLKGLKGQYGKIRSNLQDYREYNKEAAKDVENNVEKAKKDANPAQLPLKLAERLPSLVEVIKVAVYSQKDRELIFSLIKDMLKVEEDIEKVQRILQDNLEQNAKKYWDDNFKDVLEKIANGEVSNIPVEDQAMVEQVKQTFDDLKEVKELKGLIQVQEDLFKKFEEEEYNRIMEAELKISAEGKLAAEKALQQEQEVFEEVSTNNGDPEEGLADDENPEEGPADDENPEEGSVDVENPEEGLADDENPEEGPADDENPEEGPADDDCSNECPDDVPESTANVTNEESGDE